jgi:hypothetical protein
MLIVRDVFTAKPGQATKLAGLFKRAFPNDSRVRVMTDLIGPYNTVVLEMPVKDLAEFEQKMEEYRKGKFDPPLDPKVAEEMSRYTELWQTGRREVFHIVE